MTSINIPAVATGAFLGLLAIIVLVSCVPPVTRFLGDLCCCPWRVPFTKKRRRNDDEEMDKDDLPYVVAGPQSPRAGTPLDSEGYQRMSAAYLSVSERDFLFKEKKKKKKKKRERERERYKPLHPRTIAYELTTCNRPLIS